MRSWRIRPRLRVVGIAALYRKAGDASPWPDRVTGMGTHAFPIAGRSNCSKVGVDCGGGSGSRASEQPNAICTRRPTIGGISLASCRAGARSALSRRHEGFPGYPVESRRIAPMRSCRIPPS